MQFPKFLDPLSDSPIWVAVVTIVLLGLWLFGKRYEPLKSIVRRHPVLAALINLFAAPLLILQLGRFVHSIFARVDGLSFSAQINDVMLLVLLLSTAWNLARLAELFLLSIHKDDEAKYLPGLQRGLLFFVFLFLGLVMFLYLKDYSITGLYISTGAAAALVAFAMQQTLGDLFSGIALSIEHPFKLGERIRLPDGSEGKVVDINWRATRLLAWDNTTLVVPNSELAKQGFQNFHGFDQPYAPWYEVKVPAEVDPRLARALLLEAALRCDKVLKYPLPVVRLADATTIPYTYMVWVHYANYPAMFAGREQLFFEIHYALKDVGAQVSPPINELHSRRASVMEVNPPTTLLALKMLDITKSLSEEEVQELAAMSTHQSFDAGTTIVEEGHIAGYVDVVIHGVVETSIKTKSGKLKSVDHLSSGQYFGLTSMVMETPSFLHFTASTNVTLLRIDIDCLQSVLNGRPDLHSEFAAIMDQRREAAQITRMASAKEDDGFTIRDFLRRIEKLTH